MEQSLKITIGLGIILILFGAGYFFTGEKPTISAQGTSSLDATPDLVSVYLTIESRDPSSAKLAQENHKIISSRFSENLIALGIKESEIKTSYYNIGPEYTYSNNGQKLIGYLATQQVVVELKEFSKIVEVIDSSINSGVRIGNINFELSPEKQNEYKIQALKQASADAKSKASATASGVGKKIGKLVSIESQDFNYNPIAYYADSSNFAEVKETTLQMNPQDLTVSANVAVTYTIK
ncbi:DUF541 domain-containing protein [Candidatus Pacearchaeota archaeon]|nr:DUF541 domain-containing protein [Candidatus Pacearchaeota archaeon]